MQLTGLAAVVTGGASGLGRATADLLVERGAKVVVADLSEPADADTANMRFVASDITDPNGLDAAFDTARSWGLPVRGVVHCAGRGGDRKRILTRDGQPADLAGFAEMLRVNLVGTYNVLRVAAARMCHNEIVDGDRGAVVLTASVAAFDGQIGQTSYAAAKAGIHGLTLPAARDLSSWGIRVNTIAPGVFDTPMLARLRPDIREGIERSVPHPSRLGSPTDFARLAVTVLENGYLNGETIRLDGAVRMAPR
ncbi:SDR family NAD(P)-dependent oxidoreductase [Amycolatopsis ultiminotia]|uniref:SDR family NAD(P)-dependent oxidoreductase n=1 Tax=Amycolatopsis ultiminotia TaxID=543629 RepID=A0ABP6XN67_9PSEU